jgi:integrase
VSVCVGLAFCLHRPLSMTRRQRFSGSIYPRGPIWQVQYWVNGKRFRESSKSTSKDDAQKLLNLRMAEAREGAPIKPTTIGALAALYLESRRPRWKPQTHEWAQGIWTKHLEPVFDSRNPASLLPGDLDLFVAKEKNAQYSEPLINRCLVVLKAILRYGVRNKAIRESDLPEFPKRFDERPYVRQGHIDYWDFITFVNCIPDEEPWLEGLCTLAFTFGFRRAELVYMKVGQVDFERHWITLPPGSTKNKMPRTTYFNPKGQAGKMLRQMIKGKRPDHYLFSRDGGSTPCRDFRVSFDKAATAAGIKTGSGKNGKLIFHDLRRSAITQMDAAGLSEVQSMKVAGHLTPAIHQRYKILSENTARQIAEKLDPDVK